MERLESRVAEQIGIALVACGVALPPPDNGRRRGWESATPFIGIPLREALQLTRAELEGYVIAFQAAEKTTPCELVPLAQCVIAHEQALVTFAVCELERDGHDLLEGMHSIIATQPPICLQRDGN